MTLEEAKEYLSGRYIVPLESWEKEFGEQNNAVIDIAIEAIEKQIPKKPIDDSYPWVICPTCSGSVFTKHIIEHIQNKETTYCEHCGQAIDWRKQPNEKDNRLNHPCPCRCDIRGECISADVDRHK